VPKPIVPVALWYPNVDMTLSWGGFFHHAVALRDLVDYDYVDETMLRTGALGEHKILVIVHGSVMEKSDANLIAEWVKNGGRAIVIGVDKFESVEGTSEPETMLFGDTPSGRSLEKGEIVRVKNEDELASRLGSDLRDLGLAVYDLQKNGIFGTQIEPGKFLFLNTGSSAKVKIECGGKTADPRIDGGTITEVEVK
jgi:peptidyl-tRNA hydrolase